MKGTDEEDFVTGDRTEDLAGECARTRDLLPLHVSGAATSGEVAELVKHLATCAECRDEARLVERLQLARPEPPDSLAPSIIEASRRPRRPERTIVPWLLRAAAIAILAVGIGVLWRDDAPAPEPVWTVALESQPMVDWYGHDWMVAGEPLLDALPDDLLAQLMEEMEP